MADFDAVARQVSLVLIGSYPFEKVLRKLNRMRLKKRRDLCDARKLARLKELRELAEQRAKQRKEWVNAKQVDEEAVHKVGEDALLADEAAEAEAEQRFATPAEETEEIEELEEFKKVYEEAKNDVTQTPTSEVLRQLMKLSMKSYVCLIAGSAALMGTSLANTRQTELGTSLTKRVVAGAGRQELVKVLCYLMGAEVASHLFRNISDFFMSTSGKIMNAELKSKVFASLLSQEVAYFDLNKSDKLQNVLNSDSSNINDLLSDTLPNLLTTASEVVAAGLALARGNSLLCLTAIAIIRAQSLYNLVVRQTIALISKLELASKKKKSKMKEGQDNSAEVLQNLRTVKAFGRAQQELALYSVYLNGAAASTTVWEWLRRLVYPLLWMGYSLSYFGCIVMFGTFASHGLISSEDVQQYVSFAQDTIWGLRCIGWNCEEVPKALKSGARVLDVVNRAPQMVYGSECPAEVRGDIEFENVVFKYPAADAEDGNALKGINISIKGGTMVGLCGPSGCGKSTSVALLQRFYDPTSGTIKLDGRPLQTYSQEFLSRTIGIVSQEPILFATSVFENIRYGRPEATEEEVHIAGRAANIHEILMAKSQGYNTDATTLSGGQKQRVAIARALLKNPRILLLDEATSALDTKSERLVQKALETLQKDRTTIAIAHRLTTIRRAHQIIFVEDGRAVENGTHEELMAKKGKYADLVSQSEKTNTDEASIEVPSSNPVSVDAALQMVQKKIDKGESADTKALQTICMSLKAAAESLAQEKARLALLDSTFERTKTDVMAGGLDRTESLPGRPRPKATHRLLHTKGQQLIQTLRAAHAFSGSKWQSGGASPGAALADSRLGRTSSDLGPQRTSSMSSDDE